MHAFLVRQQRQGGVGVYPVESEVEEPAVTPETFAKLSGVDEQVHNMTVLQ